MKNVTKLLEHARARITDPANWTQLEFARDADGFRCRNITSLDAVCWCAAGSLNLSGDTLHATPKAFRLASRELEAAAFRLYGRNIADVNDGLGHEATLRMFDDAIKHSKMGEA